MKYHQTLKLGTTGVTHGSSTALWTDVPRCSRCTCVAEMLASVWCCCEMIVDVKVTPKVM